MCVVKINLDVAHVASVSEICYKSLFKMFHLFQMYVVSVDVAYVTRAMLQVYVSNISSVSVACYNCFI
jgi:hypothetical protein